MKNLCLLDAIRVELVLNDLFLEDLVAKFELIDTIDEILLRQEVNTGICAGAHHCHLPDFRVVNDFLQAKRLVTAYKIEPYHLL